MRCATIALLAGWVVLLQAAPAPAQKPDKKTEPKKTAPRKSEYVPQITEIVGKTIDQWIAEIHSPDKSDAENAIRTVLLFGSEQAQKAVPVLIKELRTHSFSYPLDISVRVNACIALGVILGSAKDPDEKQMKDAVTILRRMLHDTQDIVKYRAAQALGQLGPEAKDAQNDLVFALRDPNNWETRQAAALALGRVAWEKRKAPAAEVIAALSTRIKNDKSSQVRLAVLHALAALGPPADKTSRTLLEKHIDQIATHDPKPTVRIWAHMTYMILQGKVESGRLAFIGRQVVEGKELTVKLQAAQALASIGAGAKSQVHRLTEGLEDADKNVTVACILALANMGQSAGDSLPRLQQLAKNKDCPEALRHLATEAADVIEGKSKSKSDTKEKSKAPAGAQ